MFGYIMPEKPELKIREYETFRAYYCSICKAMGKNCGQISRLALNYDATFLAVLLASLGNEKDQAKIERCLIRSFKKRAVVKNDSEIIRYAADMNVLLAYYNLKDNVHDEGSLVSRAASLLLIPAAKRAGKRQPEMLSAIAEMLDDLNRIEKEKCDSMDQAAEPFAKMMSKIMSYKEDLVGKKNIEVLEWIGYNIGKWLYIIDACDDLDKDLHSGSYNPLICMFGRGETGTGGIKDKMRERVKFNLTYALSETAKGVGFLNINKNRGIIENIIYLGMLRKTENILGIGSCCEVEKSV
jgi:hypothetical protein